MAEPGEEVDPIPAISGRPVISRADMAARGVPKTTVNGWYRDRARTGHPEKAGRLFDGEHLLWMLRARPRREYAIIGSGRRKPPVKPASRASGSASPTGST